MYSPEFAGATGTQTGTGEERAWLKPLPDVPVRATSSILGHGFEPQFAVNNALAALALGREKLFPAVDSSGVEREYEGPLERVAVTAVGHWRGEGIALAVFDFVTFGKTPQPGAEPVAVALPDFRENSNASDTGRVRRLSPLLTSLKCYDRA